MAGTTRSISADGMTLGTMDTEDGMAAGTTLGTDIDTLITADGTEDGIHTEETAGRVQGTALALTESSQAEVLQEAESPQQAG